MTTSLAAENNNKLFPLYRIKLSQHDIPTYDNFAGKLAVWLSQDRAYYKEARPQIVALLMIAQHTFCQVVGADTNLSTPFNISLYRDHPMALPYVRLMKSVAPFIRRFAEPALQVQVKLLLGSIVTSTDDITLVPHAAPQASPTVIHAESKPSTSEASSTVFKTSPSPSILPATKEHATWPEVDKSTPSPKLPSPPILGLPLSRKRKRKTNLTQLVELDLTDLRRSKHNSKSDSTVIDLTALPAEEKVSLSLAIIPNQQSRTDADLTEGSQALASAPQGGIELQEGPDNTHDDVDSHGVREGRPANDHPPITSESHYEDAMSMETPSFAQLPGDGTMQDVAINRHASPAISPQNQETDRMHTHVAAVDGRTANPAPSDAETTRMLDELNEIGQGSDDMDFEIEEHDKSALNEARITSPPNKGISATVAEDSECIQDRISGVSTDLPAEITPDLDDIRDNSFSSPGQMRIIGLQRGQEGQSSIRIDFELPRRQMAAIRAWINREYSTNASHLCVSLGCYHIGDMDYQFNEAQDADATVIEQQFLNLKSAWPKHGKLHMRIHRGQAKTHLPLSPPLNVTDEGLVDISRHLSVGHNTLELVQKCAMLKHVFVLYVHHPTESQKAMRLKQQEREQGWNKWLTDISTLHLVPHSL